MFAPATSQTLRRWLLPRLTVTLLATAVATALLALLIARAFTSPGSGTSTAAASSLIDTAIAERRDALVDMASLMSWQLGQSSDPANQLPNRQDVDWILLFDGDGNLLSARSPPEDADAIASLLTTAASRPHGDARWLRDGPTLIASADLPPSQTTGGGRLILGQRIEGSALSDIMKSTGIDFALRPMLDAAGETSRDQLPLINNVIASRDGARNTLLNAVLGNLLFALLGTAAVWWLLERGILGRIEMLAGIVARRHNDRWKETDVEELDTLGERFSILVSEVDTQRRSLDYIANHDHLTGLGNRRHLGEQLAHALNHIHTHPRTPITLLLVDLKGFRSINEGLGHAAGDAALCETAKRLRALSRNGDSVARLGGSGFALLLRNVSAAQAEETFAALRARITEPFALDGRALSLDASAGATEGQNGMSVHEWLRRGDLALKAAKLDQRRHFAVFQECQLAEASRHLRLSTALARGDTEVWFQPVVDGDNGNVLGIEALVRWDFQGEPVDPREFIRIAGDSGQLGKLGQSITQAACAALARFRIRHPTLTCGINLSMSQLTTTDFDTDLKAAAQACNLPPDALWIELPEELLGRDPAELATLSRLADLGFALWLDDVGSGRSVFDRLGQLPIQGIKIDTRIVQALHQGNDVPARHLHALGQELGLKVVAEGVEHESQRQQLSRLGCRAMQGFLLARPMPEAELSAWLEHRVIRT